jgi:cell division protein FtsB
MPKTQFTQQSGLSMRRLIRALVALLILFLLLTSVISLAEKHIAIKRRIKELEEEKMTLQDKQVTLTRMNERLSTPEGQEEAIRDKYNLVRPGEGMVIITEKTEPEPKAAQKGVVSRWWDAIVRGLGFQKD